MSTRGLDRWLMPYLMSAEKRRAPEAGHSVHMLLCVCDHYEPGNGQVSPPAARARVEKWVTSYARTLGGFRDSDGRPPRHSFFYPMEQYVEADLAALAGLCRDGFGEVEVHLHHENDDSADLRKKFLDYKAMLAEKHRLLARNKKSGEIAYAFIHGNWALDNSLPDGSHCGVNDELDVLRQTGCYADFTLPSVPSAAQTRKINSIYYAKDDPNRPMSHDDGVNVGSGPAPADSLMIIQGPLILNWGNRKWGLMPRIENACVQGNQPMTNDRVDLWLKARVQVPMRPDWFFVKLHTHGAPESNAPALIGQPAVDFHTALARRTEENRNFHYHYVTAREVYNLVVAAEAGWTGSVADALDYRLSWNGAASAGASPPPVAAGAGRI